MGDRIKQVHGIERRQEGLADARATMAAIFEGPPEFVDLTVIDDFLP